MKILIIEDDINKLTALSTFLSQYHEIKFNHQTSYNSGLKALIAEKYDLLLLDMSMPIYDVTVRESGGRPLPLAGRDILFQLRRRKICLKSIVITQYEDFDGLSLQDLDLELQREFPDIYIGFVYYNITQDGWKEKLSVLLKEELRKGGDNQ